MCTPTDKPTLVAAVDAVVQSFVASQSRFSAHEITKALRESVNGGVVVVDPLETGTVHVAGKDVPKIEHEAVKGIVHDLFQASKMDGYARSHTGEFWEYSVAPPAPIDPDPIASGSGVSGDPYDGSPLL